MPCHRKGWYVGLITCKRSKQGCFFLGAKEPADGTAVEHVCACCGVKLALTSQNPNAIFNGSHLRGLLKQFGVLPTLSHTQTDNHFTF